MHFHLGKFLRVSVGVVHGFGTNQLAFEVAFGVKGFDAELSQRVVDFMTHWARAAGFVQLGGIHLGFAY